MSHTLKHITENGATWRMFFNSDISGDVVITLVSDRGEMELPPIPGALIAAYVRDYAVPQIIEDMQNRFGKAEPPTFRALMAEEAPAALGPSPRDATTYRLVRDVANPKADGRARRDWRKAASWPAGATFVISSRKESADHVQRVGHDYALHGDDVAALIRANAEEISETVSAMLTRLDVGSFHARGVYKHLIMTGRISAAEFERAWEETMSGDED